MPHRLRQFLAVGVLTLGCLAPGARAEDRPNLLFILADDLGWSDLGCYGNAIFQTPHLDRLASEGLRFTRAYAPAPICSASRASLLTGKTPARLGFEFVTKQEPGFQPLNEPLRAPPFSLDLPLEEVTIAEGVAAAGYRTAFFGKWHLNRHHQGYLGWSPTHGPRAQGFEVAEEDFGSHPYGYRGKEDRAFLELPEGEFPIDSLTRRAVDFLGERRDRPFFLMVSHFYVHTPIHTRVRWLHDRCLAAIPSGHPRRAELAHYGAMVTTLDHHVGELLDALEEEGLSDSTLVVFTSDNGGHPDYAGNAPLRGSKWNLYEGGIRVPFIARWPGKIPAGTSTDVPVSGTDLFPTFAELAGAGVPDHLDGTSLVARFRQPDSPPPGERDLVWHFPYYHPESGFSRAPGRIGIDDGVTSQTRPHSTLRSGPWKLIHFYEDSRDELYHLPSDPSEQVDRARTEPDLTRKLRRQLDSRLNAAGARFPVANPEFVPKP